MNWLHRLKSGLGQTSATIGNNLRGLIRGNALDETTLNDLEDILIAADMGVAVATRLRNHIAGQYLSTDTQTDTPEMNGVLKALEQEITAILKPHARALEITPAHHPFVVLVSGVNGVGKTTTIGKLAHLYTQQGLKVMLAAADTFRAAAIEQLQIWGERASVPVVAHEQGADAAAVAYEAHTRAIAEDMDVLLIDTAGRLQNKTNLMEALSKVHRVLGKQQDGAPHAVVLVLDATTGQNAHSQVDAFAAATPLTGLIVTKLDGTAKGGMVVSLAQKHALPLYAIGVGEGIDDLQPFRAEDFARSLLGQE